jgi:hypothetical protein
VSADRGALLKAILASHGLFTDGTTAADDRTLVCSV